MTIRNTLLFATVLLISCKSENNNSIEKSDNTPRLKTYQQYALGRIKEADFDDQGFFITDSFFLWSWDDFGKEFKQNRITRTFDSGFFYYTFWTHLRDTSYIYDEQRVSAKNFKKDTMLDNNLDGFMDFVVSYKSDNTDSIVFHLDTSEKKFVKIRP